MRAGAIFVQDLRESGLLDSVSKIKLALYGSLAATGKGHMTPQALLLGLEGADCETVDTESVPIRYDEILNTKRLTLGKDSTAQCLSKEIHFDFDKDLEDGDLLATNDFYSIGGGFVLNGKMAVAETPEPTATEENKQPPFPFRNMSQLLSISRKHNLTIAQIVYENELTWYTPEEIHDKIMNIWQVMDEGIRAGVMSEQEILPGSLRMKRRAPKLYARLMRGLYMGPRRLGNMSGPTSPEDSVDTKSKRVPAGAEVPAVASRATKRVPRICGSFHHEIMPVPPRRTNFPAMDWLSCWAIATNEQVAAGGRIVIAPTLGAAGIIPAVLRYVVEFVALTPEDEENLVKTFLLTAAAIGMLFKRGATISAAEGGCMAEVGTSCSMAAGAFAACMGGSPEVIEQAAETAIEHNLGLTCDPVDGLVQAPCIERNAVGSVKAVVSANLALSSDGVHSVTLDEAIHAARLTARDMHTKYKETSLSGLATTVKIPVAVPDC
ncbi:hypothetical protein MCAP1_000648 [Malassezia caprae]|uniref:L-serine ammonia-lyase n=1 Tax=Malassezia caprae TaxID=1381934 RepID=A0AAF0IYQ3_9BASI|nr:hypothetical protein MCAP1_000648 [Malassezia caprae]